MKKILLIALVLTGLSAKAQYFHHIYGTTDGQKLSAGINTTTLGLGHFLVGHNGQNGLSVSRTDVTGNVTGAPYFNGWYQITSSITGRVVYVNESKTFEMDNGAGFGIIGQYQDLSISSPNTGVFYLQLDPSGAVNNLFTYINTGGSYFVDVVSVGGVSESAISGGNDVYVAGTTTDNAGRVDAFAMKLDVTTGGVVWSGVYDIVLPSGSGLAYGKDIVESPWAASGVDEVVLAGHIRENTSGSLPDGFTLRLDANSGAPITGAELYGTSTSSDVFNAIAVAVSGGGGNRGFILGGWSDRAGDPDFWLTKTDPACSSTLWASLHAYNGTPGVENVCNDIIERLNTSGRYEYYAAGYVRGGLMGSYDMVVVKVNDVGVSTGFGQFTYGDARTDYGIAIDQYDNTGSDGISVFGFREGASAPIINGNYDMYLVKGYFNGETPCNQRIVDAVNGSGPKWYATVTALHVDKLQQDVSFWWSIASAHDANICYRPWLPAGSNARMAPAEEKADKQAVISPNPMTAGTPVVEIAIETTNAATAQVAIYDMLGRQYYKGTAQLTAGKNALPVDISNAGMSAGTYTVNIQYGDEAKTILLMVK